MELLYNMRMQGLTLYFIRQGNQHGPCWTFFLVAKINLTGICFTVFTTQSNPNPTTCLADHWLGFA